MELCSHLRRPFFFPITFKVRLPDPAVDYDVVLSGAPDVVPGRGPPAGPAAEGVRPGITVPEAVHRADQHHGVAGEGREVGLEGVGAADLLFFTLTFQKEKLITNVYYLRTNRKLFASGRSEGRKLRQRRLLLLILSLHAC